MVGAMPVETLPKYCNGDADSHKKAEESTEVIFEIGSRVKSGDDFGTIKFIGEVAGYKGLWYGVEWDDPSRGKHSGSVDGVEYFKTVKTGAGSFIRPNKLCQPQTCAEAIKKYYGEGEDEMTAAQNDAFIAEWKRKMKVPFVEMVGFDKIHQKQIKFDSLLEASVPDQLVSQAGNLASLCPNLRVLDVSKNLFSNWREVINIGAQLPHLSELNLSKNRMAMDVSGEILRQYAPNFDVLDELNISMCDYDWQDVVTVAHLVTNTRELVAAHNRISDLSQPTDVLQNLQVLKLDSNPIESWEEILKLGRLSKLKLLSLNDCHIGDIRLTSDESGKCDLFENLQVLFIKRNMINNWRSISELDKLKNLEKLYVSGNPLLNTVDAETSTQLLIAKIGNLKFINGSAIPNDQRRGAEYDYLKRYGAEYKACETDPLLSAAFHAEHHRFRELLKLHGLPDDSLLNAKPQNSSLTSKLIEITLIDASTGRRQVKKMPSTMLVQKLATLVYRIFPGNPKKTPKFYCLDSERNIEIALENYLKDLNYYSVKSGDAILVRFR